MEEQIVYIHAELVWTNQKCVRAISVLCNALNELGDDFSYRDDVRRAMKAATYLSKHVAVHPECDKCIGLLEDA